MKVLENINLRIPCEDFLSELPDGSYEIGEVNLFTMAQDTEGRDEKLYTMASFASVDKIEAAKNKLKNDFNIDIDRIKRYDYFIINEGEFSKLENFGCDVMLYSHLEKDNFDGDVVLYGAQAISLIVDLLNKVDGSLNIKMFNFIRSI